MLVLQLIIDAANNHAAASVDFDPVGFMRELEYIWTAPEFDVHDLMPEPE